MVSRQLLPAVQCRFFADSASSKLSEVVANEISHEKSQYEKPPIIQRFLDKKEWKFEEKTADVNMVLTKEVDGTKVSVEFQLSTPYNPEDEGGEGEGGEESTPTDFSITVEKKDSTGVIFYCTTDSTDPSHRFMIGNVKYFATAEEKDNASSYNGPEFEDLDESMQERMDEWLATLGVGEELCDFIDACAVDKEQREYMNWLTGIKSFIETK
ncbi:unnamed protein product [Vitrella brassicaformis CCMP3155]|uniref:Mitochondrial glycoprotein domain-containing protein n=1 Tax=Vitrella brassicaformis (strain CCMP3155) TaxID=1169540 RepID=A0A0G4EIV9_VITBC|nr:unnamed protein product [Vitrella brassicaformis CCMP3155]|eukprot:CEL96950.1 unnamed protein product [Vitrella brassicaformis CCMP3155]